MTEQHQTASSVESVSPLIESIKQLLWETAASHFKHLFQANVIAIEKLIATSIPWSQTHLTRPKFLHNISDQLQLHVNITISVIKKMTAPIIISYYSNPKQMRSWCFSKTQSLSSNYKIQPLHNSSSVKTLQMKFQMNGLKSDKGIVPVQK